jgi:hypothetical protein
MGGVGSGTTIDYVQVSFPGMIRTSGSAAR